jgi:NodT family efflux transporter outer membrane factor (OMF) lipoprotein
LAIAAVLVLGGCATGADIPRPDVSPSATFRYGGSHPAPRPVADLGWWHEFRDARLVRLVERAASANHDVRIAVERARQARAGTTAADARLFPNIDLMAARTHSSSGVPAAVKQSMPDVEAKRLGVEVGWEIDLFGGARAAASAAERDATAASYGVSGAQLIAASEVARQYFVWQGARQRLEILESLLQTQRDTERLTRSRNREGMASDFDVARATGEALNLEATLPPLRTLMAVTESRIAVLTATDASRGVPELHAGEDFRWTVPGEPLTGQPADLLRRRPDLLAAEQRLAAESSRLAEAKSNLFPKIFLSALFGRQELTLNSAMDLPSSRFSNVAIAFALPIFNAGRIRAGIEAQSAREQELLLSYEKAILGAIEDAEDALVVLSGEQQRVDALAATVAERDKAVARATSLFREGQIDLLQLLEVQRAKLATELALAEGHAQRAIGYVQLYKALGGGWEELPAPANAQVAANSPSGAKQ